MKITTSFSLLALTLLLTACSGKKPSERKLEVSFAALTSNDLVGGAAVRIQAVGGASFTDIKLSAPPFNVQLPDGKFNIYFVGWQGPGAYSGNTTCGGVENLDLTSSTTEIHITVANGNCANNPYATMIGGTAGKWDQGLFDVAKWGP